MNTTEELTEEAYRHGAVTVDWSFDTDRIKGLYCDGVIAVSDKLTETEKTAVLAEEIGHHLTAVGDILDQNDAQSRKLELRGRVWAYKRLVGFMGIIEAFKAGCRNRYEISEFLGVPEDMLQEAIDYYRSRYGLFAEVDNYVIYFGPLGVMEMI